MAKYLVMIQEVHTNTVEVEAPEGASDEEVRALADQQDMADALALEYSHCLDPEYWPVIQMGKCKFCGDEVPVKEMRAHQNGLVCPSCWDPRLASTA